MGSNDIYTKERGSVFGIAYLIKYNPGNVNKNAKRAEMKQRKKKKKKKRPFSIQKLSRKCAPFSNLGFYRFKER